MTKTGRALIAGAILTLLARATPAAPFQGQTNLSARSGCSLGSPGKMTVRMNQPARQTYETLAELAGFDVVFQGQFRNAGPFPYSVENVDIFEALDIASRLTGSIWRAQDDRTILVVPDSPEVRREIDVARTMNAGQTVSVTIDAALSGTGEMPTFQLWFFPAETGLRPFASSFHLCDAATPPRVVTIRPGRTVVEYLPVGDYRVSGAQNRPPALPSGYTFAAIRAGDLDLTTHAFRLSGSDSPRISITIADPSAPPEAKVKGLITGLADSPQRAKAITLYGGPSPEVTAEVDWRGGFEFPKVRLGTYGVRLDPSADSFPRTITVRFSGEVSIEVPMKLPVFAVSGSIEEMPVPQKVRLVPFEFSGGAIPSDEELRRRGLFASTVNTDAFGRFAFDGVPNDWYRVAIGDRDLAIEVAGADVDVVFSPAKSGVSVSRASGAECSPVRRGPAGNHALVTVSGTIRLDDGTPPPIVDLAFTDLEGATRYATVRGDSFSVGLPQGDSCLRVNVTQGYRWLQARAGRANLRFLPFSPLPGFGAPPADPPEIRILIGRSAPTVPPAVPAPASAPSRGTAPRGTRPAPRG